jgi:Signal transduction histidine kinase
MNLVSKYNRVNMLTATIVLVLSGLCYYFIIRDALIRQLDKDLVTEEREVKDFIKENNRLPEPSNDNDEQEEFSLTQGTVGNRSFRSVNVFNQAQIETHAYRQLEFPVTAGANTYKAVIRKSQEKTENLIRLIIQITLLMVLILLFSLFLINRILLGRIWKPFHNTLTQIKQFNVLGKNNIVLDKSDIDEFIELNQAVNTMTKRVSQDFNEIKSFTENASHEIQTPLAIINSKLELLSQSEHLKEYQMNTIQSIFDASHRLSKLNQSLLLLTKIDNKQFTQKEEIDFSHVVHEHLENFDELITAKRITLLTDIKKKVSLCINESLAGILVSNLVTNAIRHNIEKGAIDIRLTASDFSISNSGVPLGCDPAELFERFRKDQAGSESLGLGLSIVKKICDQYNFRINYSNAGEKHSVVVSFGKM